MGFKFRYHSLLSYREHLKERAEIELGSALKQLHQAQQMLETYESRHAETRRSLDLMKRITSEEMATYSDYLTGITRKIRIQKHEVARTQRIAEEKRKDLLERTKEYRIIEKLMEKDHQIWKHQELLAEQKRISEVAVTRHGREYL